MNSDLNSLIKSREKYVHILDLIAPPEQIIFLSRIGQALTVWGRGTEDTSDPDPVKLKFLQEINEIHHRIYVQISEPGDSRGLNGQSVVECLLPELESPSQRNRLIGIYDRTLRNMQLTTSSIESPPLP